MIEISQKENCCGCQACMNICPLNCIRFERDGEGFGYPVVDKEECKECGLCEKVCPFIDITKRDKDTNIDIYGAWCKDEQIRFTSSSGGLFTLIAKHIIKQGGIVFGAKVNGNGDIIHVSADKEEELEAFRKSKYVQSDTGRTFIDAKEYLQKGRQVLFSGTPCQILALHKFLGRQYDNLYTIDVICVGVSSPGVWKSYLKQLERENGSTIADIIFRHKEIDEVVLKSGQRNLTLKITFENGKILYQYHDENKFFDGFLNKLFLRPSCAQCKVKNFVSKSDIQLGDFWEIEKIYPEVLPLINETKRIPFGVSEVLIYTEKGRKLFEHVEKDIVSFKADRVLVETAQRDTNWFLLTSGSEQHWNRKAFFEEFQEKPESVYEIIKKNLGVRDIEHLFDKKIGMWGSFNLRESIRIIENNTRCKLIFQFRNSTIYSIMSENNEVIKYAKTSPNSFRARMMEYDLRKEFRIHLEEYAKNIDLFLLDLLEERYENLICGETVITKSEGYFESVGVQGLPLSISFTMWKNAMKGFMERLLSCFLSSQIIIIENYLCNQYGMFNAPKYTFENQKYIENVNQLLKEKYSFIREQWPEIKMIAKLPDELCYTQTNHSYGCIPEHMNYGACAYIAQKIGGLVK